jgi:hypothetical protein
MTFRIDELKEPIQIGKNYLVPCLELSIPKEFDEVWLDDERYLREYKNRHLIIPIHNHPHSDRENGQEQAHFHIDSRFELERKSDKYQIFAFPLRIYNIADLRRMYCELHLIPISFQHRIYCDELIHYRELKCISQIEKTATPLSLIKKSNLKHKCIHKGKCPHRGYDLTHVPEVDGVITCPLHNLKFDSSSKQLIS